MIAKVLLGLLPAFALAVDINTLQPQGRVSDFVGVVDQAARAQLDRYLAQAEQATGAEISAVTIPSLDGQPIEEFANTLFRRWGIGKKGKDEGVLLLLSIRDRKSRIEVGYALEPILPDLVADQILREMQPALRQRDYAQALMAGATEIANRIASAKGVSIPRTLPRRGPPVENRRSLPIPLIVIGILILFGFLSRGGRGGGFLGWMLLGNILSGSRGSRSGWSSGGFGGYDGGGGGSGGFGGFGGGDSGGGGASGSW